MKNLWGSYTLGILLFGLCAAGLSGSCSVSHAADTKSKSTKSKSSAKEKVSYRLPRYFASVVDDDQRAEIYEIQKQYGAKIAKLQAELAALESEQLEEIEDVLSKEQLASLNKMREGKTLTKKSSKSSGKSSTSQSTGTKRSSKKSSKGASEQEEGEEDESEEDEDEDEEDDEESGKTNKKSSAKSSKRSRSK